MKALEIILIILMIQFFFWPSVFYDESNRASCYAQGAWLHEPYTMIEERCRLPIPTADLNKEPASISIHALPPNE